MTALKIFSIAANGTPIGVFTATDANAAVLAYVQDAGYKTIEDAATVHVIGIGTKTAEEIEQIVDDWRAELDVEDLQETYENIIDDIRDYAKDGRDDHTRRLNIRREELVKCALDLEDGGLKVDWSGDLGDALAGSRYERATQDECEIIVLIDEAA